VLKVEIMGRRLVRRPRGLDRRGRRRRALARVGGLDAGPGLPGLENLALIPGTVGAAPVQNIGAYGVELKDRFDSLDAVDLVTGRASRWTPGLRFGYRDSSSSTAASAAWRAQRDHPRALRLPKPWQPVLGYLDLERKMAETGNVRSPTRPQMFDWVCAIRRAKLPDPAVIGNAGSFFKNPVVTPSSAATSSAATRHRALPACPTAASSWPPAG
jgi:UDP-N-acetylmuramate dehydrogenase